MTLATSPLCAGITAAAATSFATVNIAGHEMVEIPGGHAVIGSEWFDDSRPRWVNFKRSIFISTTATSEKQYREVMGRPGREGAAEDHPITEVSHHDAMEYLERRGGGLTLPFEAWWEIAAQGPAENVPELMEDEQGRFRPADVVDFVEGRFKNFVFEVGGDIFTNPRLKAFQRLIREAWPFFGWRVYGTPSGRLTHEEVWFERMGTEPEDWSRKRTAPVDRGPKGPYGLFNMSGNAFEWVQDWYAKHAYILNDVSSGGPDRSDAHRFLGNPTRVIRGGSWDGGPMSLRTGHREYVTPDSRLSTVGFRVAAPASAVK